MASYSASPVPTNPRSSGLFPTYENQALGLSPVFACRENPRRFYWFHPDRPRFWRLMKTRLIDIPGRLGWSGTNLENRERPGASLFSRCIQDFCDGWRSFPINENSHLYRRGRRQWISLFTNPLNIWAPVPLSRKFQFLTHFPFPAKFNIGRIWDSLVESNQYTGKVWDSRQKVKSPIV